MEVGVDKTYTTINAAIAAAHDGDTVLVSPGTYKENVVINKPNLTLRSSEKGAAIIDGGGNPGNVGILVQDNAGALGTLTIDGFKVINWDKAGIRQGMDASNATMLIQNNIVVGPEVSTQHGNGIQVSGDSSRVKNNQVEGAKLDSDEWSGSGILVANASSAEVSDNIVKNSDSAIAVISWDKAVTGTVISNNTVTSSKAGISLQTMNAALSATTVTGNTISENQSGFEQYSYGDPTQSITGTDLHGNNFTQNDPLQVDDSAASLDLEAVLAGNTFDLAEIEGNQITYSDTTAPTIKVNLNRKSYVSTGAVVGPTQKPEVEAFDAHLSKIEVTKNGKEVTHWTNVQPGKTTYKGIGWLGEGTYVIRAYDAAGNTSDGFQITIDKTAPSAPVITAPNAEQGFQTTPILNTWNASTDSLSSINHYQVAYWYDDDGHTFGGSTCSGAQIDGHNLSGCRDTTSTSRNHTPAATEQGGVTIWVRAYDNAGNVSDWSAPVHYYYDATAPVVPIATLKDNNNVNIQTNGYITTRDFTFNLSSSPDVIRYQLKYWNDITGSRYKENSPWNPSDISGYSTTPKNLNIYQDNFTQGEGTHYFAFSACDAAGNCSAYSAPFVVTYDQTAPVVHITAPDNNAVVHGTVTVSGTVTDTNPDYYYLVIKNSSNHAVAGPGVVNAANVAGYSWDTTKVPDGTYTIDLEAHDKAGNKSSASFDTVKVTVDNTAPTVTVNALTTNGQTPTVTGTVNDPEATVRVTVNEKEYLAAVTQNGTSSTWSADITDELQPGTYDITVSAADQAGNEGTVTDVFTVSEPSSTRSERSDQFIKTLPQTSELGLTAPFPAPTAANPLALASLGADTEGEAADANAGTNDEAVLGTSDKKSGTPLANTATASNDQIGKILGLTWYWWLLILAAVSGGWWLVARRRAQEV